MWSSNTPAPEATSPSKSKWLIGGVLVLLLFSAIGGVLGPAIILLALALIVLGIIALARGQMAALSITNRKTATGTLLFGLYFMVLGAATAAQTEGAIPTALALGDECDALGAVDVQEVQTLYCTPEGSGLAWSTQDDYASYQTELAEQQAAETQAEIAAAEEALQEQIDAAEERAETAETELKEFKEEAAAQAEKEAEEEEAAAARAEEERQEQQQQQREERQERQQQEPVRPAPTTQAPAPAPEAESNSPSRPYKNCTEAREAGAAPVLKGTPGYGKHLDRDGDGIGCE